MTTQHYSNSSHKKKPISFRKHNKWRSESLHNRFFQRLRAGEIGNLNPKELQMEKEKHRFDTIHANVLEKNTIENVLNATEKDIFDFLREMQQWCAETASQLQEISEQNMEDSNDSDQLPEHQLRKLVSQTVPRVAGGWCRDTLLKKDTLDIDIALDNVDGEQFCKCIVEFQKAKGMETRSIGVIVENPEQSKHLKTATTHIFGNPVDFANLRSEEYASDSRIPTIRFGTPEEDAHRRDLTINALFYNLKTHEIEDFVETGYSDLKNGIIRTPLPSYQTFLDDPLRVMRSVRMAARFHFLVSDDIFEAALQDNIKEALHTKISRERVGIEIHKILKDKDPVGAFACFREMNIADVIFTRVNLRKGSKHSHEYTNPIPLQWTDEQWNNSLFRMRAVLYRAQQGKQITGHSRIALTMAAFLSTIAPRPDQGTTLNDWVDSLVVISLRLPRKLSNDIAHLIESAHVLNPLMMDKSVQSGTVQDIDAHYREVITNNRVTLGKWIRSFSGDVYAACHLASLLHTNQTEVEHSMENDVDYGQHFAKNILNSLSEIRSMNMLLNGGEIMKELGVKRGGKFMTQVMERFTEWQISSWPCTKDDALQFVRDNKETFLEMRDEELKEKAGSRRKRAKKSS